VITSFIVALLLQIHNLESDPSKPFTHTAAGFTCPASSATARRLSVRQYDAAGRDVSCGYELSVGVTVTVYMFPLNTRTLEEAFQTVKKETCQGIQVCELLSEGPFTIGPAADPIEARRGVFRLKPPNLAEGSLVRSEVVIATRGSKLIEFRATFRPEAGSSALGVVEEYYRTFPLPMEWTKGK
jgi:hypothetical protein